MTRPPHPKAAITLRGLLLLSVAAFWLQAPALARADEATKERESFLKSNSKFLEAFRKPVGKPALATVRILTDGKEVALGTVIGPDGWIVTKASKISYRPVVR